MTDTARARKLADRIRVVVAETLERRIKDPRLGFVTITDTRVTGDLREATVFYTVYGDETERAASAAALESAKGVLRTEVGRQTGVRFTPSLSFVADAVPDTARHLDDLLIKARQQDAEVRSVAVGPWCGASPSATLACATELLGPVDVAQVSFSFQSGGDKARFVRGLKLLLEQLNGRVHVVDVGYECDADVQAVVAPYAGKGSNVFCLSRLVASDPGVWGAEGDWLGHMRTRANASGVVWRNWRLGPMGHQIVADAFTLLYAKLASAASSSSSTREQRRSVAPACRTGALVAIPPNVDEVPAVDRNRAECALDSDVCGFVPIATGASQQYVFGATANEGAEVHVCCCCNDELCIKEQLQDGMAAFHVDASGGSVTAARAESAVGRECLMVAKLTGLAKSVTVKVSNVGQPATVDHVIKIGKVLVM